MVDGALHGGAAPVGINARGCKEFVQRDIIPGPNDLVQLALQLAPKSDAPCLHCFMQRS